MDRHLMNPATIGYVLDAEHMIQYARAQAAKIYLLQQRGYR
jgi:hypothetical protein